MCSVRHRPMPSAPNCRALAASGPLSAFARTASLPLRILSAQLNTTANSRVGPAQPHADLRRGHARAPVRLAEDHLPGRAVERDDVALADDDVADRERVA